MHASRSFHRAKNPSLHDFSVDEELMKVRVILNCCMAVLCVCLLPACGNKNLALMKLPPWIPEIAKWPELEELDRDPSTAGGLERIQKSLEEGDQEIGM